MSDTAQKPVILLVFANELRGRSGFLRNLSLERDKLQAILGAVDELCDVVVEYGATFAGIVDRFRHYRDRVVVFHYAGHADGYRLLLESARKAGDVAATSGLADYLGQQKGLELVFLNGCSTQPQAHRLLDAKIPAVIATSQSIKDELAVEFASEFYRSLAAGARIGTAYFDAQSVCMAAASDSRAGAMRDGAYAANVHTEAEHWPWHLHGRREAFKFSLPEAANNPLFGLPALPDIRLPKRPFRNLERFERKHAPVFFGRGREIRDLYHAATASDAEPIILLYGQSGVGKSSLLEAGFLPRVEQTHAVHNKRRDEAASLVHMLRESLASEDDRPRLIILDQLEAVFTDPDVTAPEEELCAFAEAIRECVDAPGANSVFILSFRKEYLQEVRTHLADARLDDAYAEVPLARLDRAGIVEAVNGAQSTPRLERKYRLQIDAALASEIAADLLEDRESPLAPTLQILLDKMWDRVEGHDKRHFDRPLFHETRPSGRLFEAFVDQQFTALRAWNADAVESGFALDVLEFHVSKDVTAATRTAQQLAARYPHRADLLPQLIERCKRNYLLVDGDSDGNGTRLAHDTLAPLIRYRFDESDQPGQRARRILEYRAVDWRGEREGGALDEHALTDIDRGEEGMRAPTADEARLIAATRAAQKERDRASRNLKVVAATTVAAFMILGGLYVAKQSQLEKRDVALRAQVATNDWVSAATARDEDLDALSASHLYAGAALLDPDRERAAQAALALDFVLGETRLVAVAETDPIAHPDGRRFVVLSEEGAEYFDGAQVEAPSKLLQRGYVRGASFSPDGTRLVLLGFDGGTLWDASSGTRIGDNDLPADAEQAVFSSDSERVAIVGFDTVSLFDARSAAPIGPPINHPLVVTALFSPNGERMLTAGDEGIKLVDVRTGEVLDSAAREEFDEALFSEDARRLLIWRYGDDEAHLFDLGDDKFGYPFALAHSQLRAARFLADDSVMTRGKDAQIRIWDAYLGEMRGAPIPHSEGSDLLVLDGGRFVTVTPREDVARIWDAGGERVGADLEHEEVLGVVNCRGRLMTFSVSSARLWDAYTGEPLSEPFPTTTRPVVANSFDVALTFPTSETVEVRRCGDGLGFGEIHHAGMLFAVYSPNDDAILTVGADDARLWDPSGPKPIGAPMVHPGIIGVDFNPGGDKLTTWSGTGRASVWNAATATPIVTALRHDGFDKPSFLTDELLVTRGRDRLRRLWHVAATASTRPDTTIRDGRYGIGRGERADQATIVDLASKQTLASFDVEPGRRRDTIMSAEGRFGLITRRGTGAFLRTAGNTSWQTLDHKGLDGGVAHTERVLTWGNRGATLWDARTGSKVADLTLDNGIDRGMFSPDGSLVVAWGYRYVGLWRADTGESTGIRFDAAIGHAPPRFCAGGRHLAVEAQGRLLGGAAIDLWDVQSGERVGEQIGGPIAYRAFSTDGDWLVVADDGEQARARLWDLRTGSQLGRALPNDRRHAPMFAGDSRALITWPARDAFQIHDATTGKPVGEPIPQIRFRPPDFSADGAYVASYPEVRRLQIWDVRTGAPIGTPLPVADGQSVLLSRDGGRIAISTDAPELRIMGIEANGLTRLATLAGDYEAAAFSADAQFLATIDRNDIGRDDNVEVWRSDTGDAVGQPVIHRDVQQVTFRPQSAQLLTRSFYAASWRLWNWRTGALVHTHDQSWGSGPQNIRSMEFSPDGMRLVIRDASRGVFGWDLQSGEFGPNTVSVAGDGLFQLRQVYFAALRDLAGGEKLADMVLASDREPVFFADSSQLLVKTLDGDAQVWGIDGARTPMLAVDGEEGALANLRNGRVITWSAEDQTPLTTGVDNPRLSATVLDHFDIQEGAYLENESRLILISNGAENYKFDVEVHNLTTGAMDRPDEQDGEDGHAFLSRNGRTLFVQKRDSITVLSAASLTRHSHLPLAVVHDVVASADGSYYVVQSDDGLRRVIDSARGEQVFAFPAAEAHRGTSVFDTDNACVLSWRAGSQDDTLTVRDNTLGQPIALLNGLGSIRNVWSRDSCRLITVDSSRGAHILDLRDTWTDPRTAPRDVVARTGTCLSSDRELVELSDGAWRHLRAIDPSRLTGECDRIKRSQGIAEQEGEP